jgi:hypothetical protein
MARTPNQRTRDEQIVNLLLGILTELKTLNAKWDKKNAKK